MYTRYPAGLTRLGELMAYVTFVPAFCSCLPSSLSLLYSRHNFILFHVP